MEYIDDVRRVLSTLPPLRFVLIVGNEPATTLEGKLARLEAAARVPIRFCTAQDLADLRESILGPLPLATFTDQLLVGPHVLPPGFVGNVVRTWREAQAAHENFVSQMMATREIRTMEISIAERHQREHDQASEGW